MGLELEEAAAQLDKQAAEHTAPRETLNIELDAVLFEEIRRLSHANGRSVQGMARLLLRRQVAHEKYCEWRRTTTVIPTGVERDTR